LTAAAYDLITNLKIQIHANSKLCLTPWRPFERVLMQLEDISTLPRPPVHYPVTGNAFDLKNKLTKI
jgi:hypothetical protein